MLPQERALVRKLAGKPFTLLGINSDQSRSALKDILAKEKITWPNIWQGTPSAPGSIAEKWNVWGWPTIYVLDHEGVIRFKGLRDQALEDAVAKLVKDVPPKGAAMTQPAEP